MKNLRTQRLSALSSLAFGFMTVVLGAVAGTAQVLQTAAPLSDPRPGWLSLQGGEVETAKLENLLQELPERFDNGATYVVQLDGPIDSASRETLEELGVVLHEYLPHYAYLAELSAARPALVARSGLIQWIGRFEKSWKIDRTLGKRAAYATEPRRELAEEGKVAVILTLFRQIPAETAIDEMLLTDLGGLTVHRIAPLAGNVTISATLPLVNVPLLADLDSIQFIEEAPEVTFRNNTNRWIVQSNQSNITPFYDNGIHGEGQVIAVMDGRIDVNHCSFSDANPIGPTHRKILAYNTALGADGHGTHVGGTAAGDSGADNNSRGVAYSSKIVFHDTPSFNETAMYGRLQTHHNQGARLHTNSWGDDGTTNYNSLARGIDSFSRDFEESLVLFASTNTSSLKNPENAKNVLAVGASQDTPSQGSFCSGGTGPTSDGRRKPEIFAPGCSTNSSSAGTSCGTVAFTGTSMACPAVAGTGALVRQYYVDGYYPSGAANPGDSLTPSGALLKATLLNASVDMSGISGYPSNQEGWGRVIADRAAFFNGDSRNLIVLDDVRNSSGLSTGNVVEHSVEVEGTLRFQVTMVFTDVPASAGTGSAAASVNDLDLEVVSPSGDLFRGNVFGGGQSSTGGTADVRNNVEQVHIDNPELGSWTVRVKGTAVNQSTQGYALVATGDVTMQLPPLRVSLPNGTPTLISPGATTDIQVIVSAGAENVVNGSPTLHYRANGGSFQSITLTPQGGDNYLATIPVVDCGENPEFYFSAAGDGGATVFNPSTAPASFYSSVVGAFQTLVSDDFESDTGWTVENVAVTGGAWGRGTPSGLGDRGDPTTDFDGSGQCYLTENGAGNTDVDGGPTRLVSPTYDLVGTDSEVSYAYWFSNNTADDTFLFQVSANGGSSWITVETVGPGGGGGWVERRFRINDFVVPSNQMRFRFLTSDSPNDSVTEAAVDAFMIEEFGCQPVGDAPDLGIENIQVDYDSADGDIDAGPGAIGQAVRVVVTVRNEGNLTITSADLAVTANVAGGATRQINRVVTDFGAAAGVQTLAPGGFADLSFDFAAGQLGRCGTYTLSASHLPGNLLSIPMGGGSTSGDTDSANDGLTDHPDNTNDPGDAFSPDLLELDFGTLVAVIRPESLIIEDYLTERVRFDLDYAGLGPGMDSNDVRLAIDVTDDAGAVQYLNVFSRTKNGAPSSGVRSIVLRVDLSGLFPAPSPGDYGLRLRLFDINSNEVCISTLSSNTFQIQ